MGKEAKRNNQTGAAQRRRQLIQPLVRAEEKSFGKKYCMHPQASLTTCNGGIVNAHTIQRNGGLTRIARNGHVYNFIPDYAKMLLTGTEIEPRLIGIKKASTFTGFCAYHDNSTFELIEKYPFQTNVQHVFLLGYRALCKELFIKKGGIENIGYQRELNVGRSLLDQLRFLEMLKALESGVQQGVQALQRIKAEHDSALLSNNYADVKYYVLHLNRTPDFLCSGALWPEFDFQGRMLQDMEKSVQTSSLLDWLTFSLIPTDKGGAAVFGWLGKSRAGEDFVKSLHALPDDQIPHALVRFTFQFFENVFVSPTWWEGLAEQSQNKLLQRQRGGSRPPIRQPTVLIDDGLRAVSWEVTERETNIELG